MQSEQESAKGRRSGQRRTMHRPRYEGEHGLLEGLSVPGGSRVGVGVMRGWSGGRRSRRFSYSKIWNLDLIFGVMGTH